MEPESIEVRGRTTEEAIHAALDRLGVTRDEVEIEILSEGRSGVFGMGSQEARVRVTVIGEDYPYEDDEELPAWEAPDIGPDPSRALASRQAHAAMSAAIRALPRRQQQAFLLRVLEGLNVADTAKAMGCSAGSVKTHLSRAMDALRSKLEDWR